MNNVDYGALEMRAVSLAISSRLADLFQRAPRLRAELATTTHVGHLLADIWWRCDLRLVEDGCAADAVILEAALVSRDSAHMRLDADRPAISHRLELSRKELLEALNGQPLREFSDMLRTWVNLIEFGA